MRRKDVLLTKDVLKFEKSLELASKHIKEAESVPKVMIDDSQEQRVSRVRKEATSSSAASTRLNQSDPDVIVRRPVTSTRLTQSFIQNRDSIHWGADSDEDDPPYADDNDSNGGGDFVDVTEAPVSAFTAVNRTNGHSQHSPPKGISPNRAALKSNSPSAFSHSTIPNGRMYSVPPPTAESENDHDSQSLREQCQKLAELQRSYNQTPISDVTPTSSRSKPTIAPKPHIGSKLTIVPRNLSNGNKTLLQLEAANSKENSRPINGHNGHDMRSTTV